MCCPYSSHDSLILYLQIIPLKYILCCSHVPIYAFLCLYICIPTFSHRRSHVSIRQVSGRRCSKKMFFHKLSQFMLSMENKFKKVLRDAKFLLISCVPTLIIPSLHKITIYSCVVQICSHMHNTFIFQILGLLIVLKCLI